MIADPPADNSHPGTTPGSRPGRAVYLETFGCQMNVLDTQLVRGQLQGLGYRFVDDWKQADVVLYNTCSVRERAEQKVWSRVGEVGLWKKSDRPDVVLGVIGCMAERDGADMVRRHPQIDLLCGPGELDKVPMLIDNAVKTALPERGGVKAAGMALQGNTHRRSATLAAAEEDQLERIDLSRSFNPDDELAAGRSAYVRITRGCNKFCTYCVVPFTRGREVHRPPNHIVDECQRLVDAGVREITLLGQTVNHYHFDTATAVTINGTVQPQVGTVIAPNTGTGGPSPRFNDTTTSFAQLLARIHDEVPALQRLRFVTSFPRDFGNDILEVMRDRPRLCRYLHIPVQSGSNRLLKLMNRGYTVEEYDDLIARVRHYLPDAEIATDIICGFPTETEEDHQATAGLLRRGGFKNSFIFKYSARPGTVAMDRFDDDVPNDVKKRRNNELLAIQSEISTAVHQAYVGRTVRVFVESISAKARKAGNGGMGGVELGWEQPEEVTQLTGRTDGDLIVCFEADPSLIGEIVEVRVERAAPLTLFGRRVGARSAALRCAAK
ncbi:MAG: MiaB/RimO family radical SAM methylthiotransferase [Phycisphaeraceae bacterium]